eukprot:362200-Chlamydomonas_euryale.AAC.9
MSSPSSRIEMSLWVAMTTASNSSTSPACVVTLTRPEDPSGGRTMDATGQPARASGISATTFLTYSRLRPFTTRHIGRWKMSSRWWLTQNRMSICTGNCSTCMRNGTLHEVIPGSAVLSAFAQAGAPVGTPGSAG